MLRIFMIFGFWDLVLGRSQDFKHLLVLDFWMFLYLWFAVDVVFRVILVSLVDGCFGVLAAVLGDLVCKFWD